MAMFPDPFGTLLGLQDALESFRTSGWLQSSPSGGGSYPPLNIFRKGDDLVLIAEVPGIDKSDLDVQVKGRTVRIAGTKTVKYLGQCEPASPGAIGGPFRPVRDPAGRTEP